MDDMSDSGAGHGPGQGGPGPDIILRGGAVRSRFGGQRIAAVALSGGRIVAAGDEALVMRLARPSTRIIDLRGAPLIG
jgi:predicted amidohydrolase YtcJ